MLPTEKKKSSEIKSPFSQGNPKSKGYPQSSIFHQDSSIINDEENIISKFNQAYSKKNTSSDFIKTTYSIIPKSFSLKKNIKIPFVMNITPLSNSPGDPPLPIAEGDTQTPFPQCRNPKCGAYINPFVEINDEEEIWKCNICKNINKMTESYYDIDDKFFLNNGTYEFITNNVKDVLIKDRPKFSSCNYYFLIDISLSSVNSGFTQCVLETIKDIINNNFFENYENIEIKACIITYDEKINFYPINIKNENENNISMLILNENMENLFLPTNKDLLLVDLKKYKNKFIHILENIQTLINSENYTSSKEATKFFETVKICDMIGDKKNGKILIFSGSNLSKLYLMNSTDEKNNNNDSINNKYRHTDGGKIGKLGISISLHGISVNIFQALNTNFFTNIKTLNQLMINTNGNLFFYKNFEPSLHYKSLYNQVSKIFQNLNVYEAGLKLRFSHKFGIKDYITPVLLYNKEIIYFPNLDSEQNYSFNIEMNYKGKTRNSIDINDKTDSSEDYIINDDFMYMQVALMYIRGDGKKIIRVYNLCFPVSSKPEDIYNSINPEILGSINAQLMVLEIYRNKQLKDSVINYEKNFYDIMKAYFNNMNMAITKKDLSDNMKTFVLYILGIFKNCLFNKNEKGFNNDIDITNFYFSKIQKMKIDEILCFIYPRIYPLNNILDGNNFPNIINTDWNSMENNGNIFLIDNGFYLILYIKNNLEKNYLLNLFDVDDINKINYMEINEENFFVDNDNNSLKNKIMNFIDSIRSSKTLIQNLKFIFEGYNDSNGKIIKEILIEDNFNKEFPLTYEKFFNKIIFES